MSETTSQNRDPETERPEIVSTETRKMDLKDPSLVLSLLEADQIVAAKRGTRFGRRKLSLGVRVLLWGLRVYVIVMLIVVLISVLRAIHPAH